MLSWPHFSNLYQFIHVHQRQWQLFVSLARQNHKDQGEDSWQKSNQVLLHKDVPHCIPGAPSLRLTEVPVKCREFPFGWVCIPISKSRLIYIPSAVEAVGFPCLCSQTTDHDAAATFLGVSCPPACEDRHVFPKLPHIHTKARDHWNAAIMVQHVEIHK